MQVFRMRGVGAHWVLTRTGVYGLLVMAGISSGASSYRIAEELGYNLVSATILMFFVFFPILASPAYMLYRRESARLLTLKVELTDDLFTVSKGDDIEFKASISRITRLVRKKSGALIVVADRNHPYCLLPPQMENLDLLEMRLRELAPSATRPQPYVLIGRSFEGERSIRDFIYVTVLATGIMHPRNMVFVGITLLAGALILDLFLFVKWKSSNATPRLQRSR